MALRSYNSSYAGKASRSRAAGVAGLAGADVLDDAELEPLRLLDHEPQVAQVGKRPAPEMFAFRGMLTRSYSHWMARSARHDAAT